MLTNGNFHFPIDTSNTPCEAFTGASSVLLAVLNEMAKEMKAAMAAMAFQSLDELPCSADIENSVIVSRCTLYCIVHPYMSALFSLAYFLAYLQSRLPPSAPAQKLIPLAVGTQILPTHIFLWKNTPGTGSLPTDDCVTPGRGDGQTCANRAIVDLIIGPLD
jgi:hypothetical protein